MRKVWIVPAPFCDMQYIDGAGYVPGDTTVEFERVNKSGEDNVLFLQTMSLASPRISKGCIASSV